MKYAEENRQITAGAMRKKFNLPTCANCRHELTMTTFAKKQIEKIVAPPQTPNPNSATAAAAVAAAAQASEDQARASSAAAQSPPASAAAASAGSTWTVQPARAQPAASASASTTAASASSSPSLPFIHPKLDQFRIEYELRDGRRVLDPALVELANGANLDPSRLLLLTGVGAGLKLPGGQANDYIWRRLKEVACRYGVLSFLWHFALRNDGDRAGAALYYARPEAVAKALDALHNVRAPWFPSDTRPMPPLVKARRATSADAVRQLLDAHDSISGKVLTWRPNCSGDYVRAPSPS